MDSDSGVHTVLSLMTASEVVMLASQPAKGEGGGGLVWDAGVE